MDERSLEKNAMSRAIPKNPVIPGGMMIPEEEAADYEAPAHYSPRAKKYLEWLARNGTMSGACKMAGIAVNWVYMFREEYEDFEEEEERARDLVTDWIEQRSLLEVMSSGTASSNSMKQFMLKTRRRKVYGDKQEVDLNAKVAVSWLDLMKSVDAQK